MHKSILAILLMLGILGAAVSCKKDGDKDRDDEHQKKALNPPKEPGKRPQGMTGLKVKPGAAEPFSKQDVVAYFKTHNLPRNAGSIDQFKVDKVEFITSAEASKRLEGASTGLKENERVGFVTLVGTFVFTGPPKSKPAIFKQAYALFDAATGNLLMVGSLGRPVQDQGTAPK